MMKLAVLAGILVASFASIAIGAEIDPPSTAPSDDPRPFIPPNQYILASPTGEMEAAAGWRSDGQEPASVCVIAKSKRKKFLSAPSSLFYRVDTQYQLDQALQVSASASTKYYGAGGNASYNQAQTLKLLDNTIYIVGSDFVIVSTEIAEPPDSALGRAAPLWKAFLSGASPDSRDLNAGTPEVLLKPDALALLKSDPDKFLKKCGDSYVTSIAYGGSQTAVFSLRANSREEYWKVSGSFGLGFDAGPIGNSLTVADDSRVKQFASENRLNILESRTGAVLPKAIDLETFKKNITEFTTDIAAQKEPDQSPVLVSLQRYDRLPSWPQQDVTFPKTWGNGIFLAQEEQALEELIGITQHVIDTLPAQALDDDVNEQALKQSESEIQYEINKVKENRNRCSASPAHCSVDGLWQDDYPHRAILPALIADLPSWIAQQNLKLSISHAQAELDYCNSGTPVPVQYAPVCYSLPSNIAAMKSRAAQAESATHVDSINHRMQLWLTSVNRTRCVSQQRQWGCVNSKDIESYRIKLLANTGRITAPSFLAATEPPTINVKCICKTKNNPSWCTTNLGDFEDIDWYETAYQNDKITWDQPFIAEYCHNHSNLACLCDDIKYFSGSVQQ